MVDTETVKRSPRRPPFGVPHVFVLAVIDGTDVTAVHRLIQPETVIGRGETANFSVDDEEVSKRHCMIRVEGSICTLLDLGSLNGTSLNGRRVREGVAQRLRHLDEIQIGGTRMLLLTGRFKQRGKNDQS